MLTDGKIVFFKHLKVSFELKKQTQLEQEMQHICFHFHRR